MFLMISFSFLVHVAVSAVIRGFTYLLIYKVARHWSIFQILVVLFAILFLFAVLRLFFRFLFRRRRRW